MGGEGVPQEVGVDAIRLEPGGGGELAQDEERARARERAALGVEEELGAVAAIEKRAPAGEIAAEGLRRLAADRNDALLRAFAEAADEAALEIDGRAVEPDCLADAQARSVHELDERAVAQRARRRSRCGLDQPLRLAGRERARKRARAAREVELCGRVVGARADEHLVAIEGTQRGDAAADRRRCEPAGSHARDVRGEALGSRLLRRAFEERGDVGEVAPVRIDGARGEPRGREREERVDGAVGAHDRGCAWSYTRRRRRASTCEYTWVVERELCPSSSWIVRRSAPPSSRCVANAWRSRCGCGTRRRSVLVSSRLPCAERKRAFSAPRASSGRASRR